MAEQKAILGAAGVLSLIILLVQATLLWIAQKDAYPEQFGSIPKTMWYSVLQLTGVGGYEGTGWTPAGKIIASITAVLAIAIFALPIGVIADGFTDRLKKIEVTCPSCGHSFVHNLQSLAEPQQQ